MYGNDSNEIYFWYNSSLFIFSLFADLYSLKDNGYILISIYLPDKRVASSLDSKKALEPVMYKSTFLLMYKLSIAFWKSVINCF